MSETLQDELRDIAKGYRLGPTTYACLRTYLALYKAIDKLDAVDQQLSKENINEQRYLWLRDKASTTAGKVPLPFFCDSQQLYDAVHGSDLDLAIDTAMQAK